MLKDNILPYDGELFYIEKWLDNDLLYYSTLLEQLPWMADKGVLFGKEYISKRKMVWMAENNLSYNYAQNMHSAIPFAEYMSELLNKVKVYLPKLNSCLANHYADGTVGMGYHADNEKELGTNPSIASISLGAERKFKLRHNQTKEVINLNLKSGSLLIMQGNIQANWKHSIPMQKRVKSGRINLTFRHILT